MSESAVGFLSLKDSKGNKWLLTRFSNFNHFFAHLHTRGKDDSCTRMVHIWPFFVCFVVTRNLFFSRVSLLESCDLPECVVQYFRLHYVMVSCQYLLSHYRLGLSFGMPFKGTTTCVKAKLERSISTDNLQQAYSSKCLSGPILFWAWGSANC